MPTDAERQRIAAQTHAFQLIRPFHPQANAVCPRCDLALPHGPILLFGMVPCGARPPVQDN